MGGESAKRALAPSVLAIHVFEPAATRTAGIKWHEAGHDELIALP
jgi:hypothetical protein